MQSRHKATLGGRYVELYTSSKPVFDQVHATAKAQACDCSTVQWASELPAAAATRVDHHAEVTTAPKQVTRCRGTGEEEQWQDCRLPTEASGKNSQGPAGCASDSAAAAAAGRWGSAGAGARRTARHAGDAQAAGPAI